MHLALVRIEDAGSNLVKAVAEEHPGDKEDCPVCKDELCKEKENSDGK